MDDSYLDRTRPVRTENIRIGSVIHRVRVLGPNRLETLGLLDETALKLWMMARADIREGNHELPSLNRAEVMYLEWTVDKILQHCIPTLGQEAVDALSLANRVLLCDEPMAAEWPKDMENGDRR